MNSHELCTPQVSTPAILALACGIVSVSAFLFLGLLVIAGLGLFLGCLALWQMRRHEHSRSSRHFAFTGVGACSLVMCGAPAWDAHAYQGEAPPGFQRLNMRELFPEPVSRGPWDEFDPDASSIDGSLLHADTANIKRLEGRQICLKGYVLPTGQATEITQFALTVDGGTDNGRYVGVLLAAGIDWDFIAGGVAVSGEFAANPDFENGDVNEPRFLLKNATVRPSRTSYDISQQTRHNGC